MAWDSTKVPGDLISSADYNSGVTDQKARLKTKTNITGASCTGNDGDVGRTYNLGTTVNAGCLVFVNRAVMMDTLDYTFVGTTITFGGVNIYNSDYIMIIN